MTSRWSADPEGRRRRHAYDNASRLTRLSRPNGTYRTQDYDGVSQLKFIKEFKSDGTLSVRGIAYRPRGVQSRADYLGCFRVAEVFSNSLRLRERREA